MSPSRIGCFRYVKGAVDSGTNEYDSPSPRARRPAASILECIMIVILGLIILVAAVIAGVGGVLGNSGSGHALSHGFSVLGYHVTGSTGTLFLYGIVVGAIAMSGLTLLLAGLRRTSRRGRAARLGLKQSRRDMAVVTEDRDNLIGQRDTARAAASHPEPPAGEPAPGDGDIPAAADAPAEPAAAGQPSGN
jgi:hypothetical protein